MGQLDKIKAERDEAIQQGWQRDANRSGTDSMLHKNLMSPTPKERRNSIFSDADRVEKLINLEFTFEKCYGKEPIEAKYYQALR